MFKRFTVGSVLGVDLEVDITLALALPLISGLIATQVTELASLFGTLFGLTFGPGIRTGVWPWLLGLAAALGLFASVALHEFGHTYVALSLGYDIDSITLWILGGVAEFADTPRQWWHDVVIAVAGPVVSVALAGGLYGTLLVLPGGFEAVAFVVAYLGVLNVVLAAFNLLPGFPMDGGRVLRGLLARTRPMNEATAKAARVGQFVALLLGLAGLVWLNLFLVAIAFFVYIGAGAEATRAQYETIFGDMTVAEVMTPAADVETVAPETTVEELYDRMYETHYVGYPVVDDGELVGIVTLSDISSISIGQASSVRIEEVMSEDVVTVSPDESVVQAFERLRSNGVARLPVVRDGDFAGLVSETDVMRVLRITRTQDSLAPAQSDASRRSPLESV
ncbi:MAG: site-2 protease family protein [Haloplanus sp.]